MSEKAIGHVLQARCGGIAVTSVTTLLGVAKSCTTRLRVSRGKRLSATLEDRVPTDMQDLQIRLGSDDLHRFKDVWEVRRP